MNQSNSPYLQNSFNRMLNIGNIGGLGGRMGELEKASMRLGEAASQRRMGETQQEYGLRGGLMEKEYGLKDVSMGKEYGLRGDLAGKESGFRQNEMKLGSGLRINEMGKESGFRQNEMNLGSGLRINEEDARIAGIGKQSKAQERASLESEKRSLQSKSYLSPEERERLNQINRQLQF